MNKKNSCVQVYENTEASVGCTKLILTHHHLNFYSNTRTMQGDFSWFDHWKKKYKTAKVRIQMSSPALI